MTNASKIAGLTLFLAGTMAMPTLAQEIETDRAVTLAVVKQTVDVVQEVLAPEPKVPAIEADRVLVVQLAAACAQSGDACTAAVAAALGTAPVPETIAQVVASLGAAATAGGAALGDNVAGAVQEVTEATKAVSETTLQSNPTPAALASISRAVRAVTSAVTKISSVSTSISVEQVQAVATEVISEVAEAAPAAVENAVASGVTVEELAEINTAMNDIVSVANVTEGVDTASVQTSIVEATQTVASSVQEAVSKSLGDNPTEAELSAVTEQISDFVAATNALAQTVETTAPAIEQADATKSIGAAIQAVQDTLVEELASAIEENNLVEEATAAIDQISASAI